MNDFIVQNKKYWGKDTTVPIEKTDEIVLAEGYFALAGPNYAIRLGSIVKTIEDETGCKPLVYLSSGDDSEEDKKKIWRSFNIHNFIGLRKDIGFKVNLFSLSFFSLYYFFKAAFYLALGASEKFVKLEHCGLQIGDLIYDSIIKKNNRKTNTIKYIQLRDIRYFISVILNYLYSKWLYNNYNVKYLVTTHSQYTAYGMITRYMFSKGVTVFETTDDLLFIFDKTYNEKIPKFHVYMNLKIKDIFAKIYENDYFLDKTQSLLEDRFSGKLEQIDVKLAYSNKVIYSKQTIKEALFIENDNPIVFIFAHVFADAPCGLSNFQLFEDYYVWLSETVKKCSNITDVNWIVKEHPSVDAYGERGEVKKLVKKYNKYGNIYNCPDNFSTASVKEIAQAIVTAQGTVGLEFSCVGIPVIVTSKPFYAGFGFTYEPKSKSEYFSLLENITQVKILDKHQIKSALTVYAAFSMLQNKDFALIDTQIKNLTWGSSVPQDIPAAFELMAQRLETINPKDMYFVKQVREYIEKN